jgi:putative colanic acid biosynthesis UDP-glucose lipid carrier transferase
MVPTVLRTLFFIGDLFFLNVSVLISSLMMSSDVTDRTYLLVFSNLAWLFLVMVSSPYGIHKGWSVAKIMNSQFAFIFIHLLVVASLIFFFRRQYSVWEIGAIYLFFVPLFFLGKIATYYLRKIFTSELTQKNFIVIGRNEISTGVRRYYLSNPQLGYRFRGYMSDLELSGPITNDIHEIFYCLPHPDQQSLGQLVKFGLDSLIKVRIVVEPLTAEGGGIKFDSLESASIKDVSVVPLDDPGNQFVKRIFDIVFSAIFLLFVMSWLLPILFVLVKLDSRGPLFFLQARSGKDNRPFYCMKFRTMVVNAQSDHVQATKNDPRITRLGAFLRKTSLDELPQFINVLVGDMSVVGPRPHMLKHTEEYSKLIEQFMGRHYVKPGITGLAQCMGYRGETENIGEMINRVRLDRHYIESWSFWLDLKIIVLTVISLIRGSDKAF